MQQVNRPAISCEGADLDNVYTMKYLGTLFTADGDQMKDISARIAQATTRCGQLRHIFSATSLSLHTKLRLYEAAVASLLTYGSETWFLNPCVCRKLRGANSRMLSWFTGNSIPHEARPATTSFNIIQKIRTRRLRWAGHIPKDPQNPSCQALKALHLNPVTGSLLMDAPIRDSIEEIAIIAKDRAAWRVSFTIFRRPTNLRSDATTSTAKSSGLQFLFFPRLLFYFKKTFTTYC